MIKQQYTSKNRDGRGYAASIYNVPSYLIWLHVSLAPRSTTLVITIGIKLKIVISGYLSSFIN